jgi:hypothetical protein
MAPHRKEGMTGDGCFILPPLRGEVACPSGLRRLAVFGTPALGMLKKKLNGIF